MSFASNGGTRFVGLNADGSLDHSYAMNTCSTAYTYSSTPFGAIRSDDGLLDYGSDEYLGPKVIHGYTATGIYEGEFSFSQDAIADMIDQSTGGKIVLVGTIDIVNGTYVQLSRYLAQ